MKPKRIIRAVKSAVSPSEKVHLEKVLGFTIQSNACLDCSVDGTVAYPAGCVVVLYNAKKTKQSHIFNVSKKTITSLAFSGDGKHLVTGESGHQPAVRVWEIETCTQAAEFHGHKFGISCVAFSPNLKYIISVGTQHDMTVNVWNWKSNCKIASNKVTSKVADVAFSQDGSSFVTVGTRHVKFWYLDSTKSRINETVPLMGRAALLGDHKNNLFCGVCCGKGEMEKSTFVITKTGLLCEFNEKRHMDKWVELRTASASCLAVNETNIFIGCADGIVRVFSSKTLHYIASLPRPHFLGVDVAAGQDPSHMVSPPNNAKYPDTLALAYDPQHQKITCVYSDHSMYVWDVHDIKRVGKSKSFLYHSSSIWGLELYPKVEDKAALPDGSFITCGSDDTIRIWNINQSISTNTAYKRNIYSSELLKVIYTDRDLTYICEKETNPGGKTDKTDTTHSEKNGIRCVRVSPDGQHLASGDRTGNVRIHDLTFANQQQFIEAHDTEVLCLEFTNPDTTGVNFLASTSRDRLLHVFDRDQDFGLIQTLDDHSAAVTSVKFAKQDGQLHMMSCGVDKSILFRNAIMEPEFQFVLNRHLMVKTTLYDMTVDPSAKFVATACQDRNVRIYNLKNGKQKTCYSGSVSNDGTLLRIEMDNTGGLVATSCSDKNLCILDFFTGELLASMFGHSEVVTGVKFMNDMRRLISVSGDGCIFIWRLPQDFAENIETRRMKIAEAPVVANGEIASQRKGTFMIPKSQSTPFVHHDSTDFGATSLLDNNANVPEPEKHDYRFSIGQLPSWAKNKVLQEPLKPPPNLPGGSLPTGAWAKNVSGPSVPIKSADDSDIHLTLADCMGKPKPKRDKRRFTVEADTLSKQIKQLDQADSKRQVSVVRDDDENRDDDDDDDFHAMTAEELEDELAEGDAESSQADTSRVNMFRGLRRMESQVDFDNTDDMEQADVIYLDHDMDSPDSVTSSFHVFEGDNGNAKEMKKLKRRISDKKEKSKASGSEGTDVPSLDDVTDDENDVTGPDTSKGATTPDQEEKFLRDNFLKMELMEQEAANTLMSHRSSISTKFLTRSQQPPHLRQTGGTLPINRNAKKKEEANKAIEESRRKLQTIGWNSSVAIKSSKSSPLTTPCIRKDTAAGRRSTGGQRRKPEPGSDRRKTIGEASFRTDREFRSPIPSPVPSFGTPERRRWTPDSQPSPSSSPMRKWNSMLDVAGQAKTSSNRLAPRSKTPTAYRGGSGGGRVLPQPPAAARGYASKADLQVGGALKKNQSRSEKNILAAVENVDPSDKRKSSDNVPSYLKQTSSSTAKLIRAKSSHGLSGKEDIDTTAPSPRPGSGLAITGAPPAGSTAAKGAAARKSAAARRERLNAGLKSRYKSTPNLTDGSLVPKEDKNIVDVSKEYDVDDRVSDDRMAMPPPLAVAPPRDENTAISQQLQDRLSMPPPPPINRVPKSNTFSGGLSQTANIATDQIGLNGDVKNITPREAFSVSPRSDTNIQSNTALLRQIYEANATNISPSTARTVSEINDVMKATQSGMPPWHSLSPVSNSTVADSPRSTGSNKQTDLVRSASSDSLDETPVKEERRAKVEMTNIRLSSPAPPTLPSSQPPPLPSQPPPTDSHKTPPAAPPKPSDSWIRPRNTSHFISKETDGILKPPERLGLRRREGEPDDLKGTSRLFLTSTPASENSNEAYRPYARPRSSIDSTMNSDLNDPASPRLTEPSEGRQKTGTLLSRNKDLLANLLTSHKTDNTGIVSSSPQVPRRQRGTSLTSGSQMAGKFNWMKQLPAKHPLDVTGTSSQSSSASSSAVTSPRMALMPASPGEEPPMSPPSKSHSTNLLSNTQNTQISVKENSVEANKAGGDNVTLSGGLVGSQTSAFRRTTPRDGVPQSLHSSSQSSPRTPDSLASPRQKEEDLKSDRSPRDRSNLKLDLKTNKPAHKPEEIKEVMAGLQDYVDKLAEIIKEHPEVLKENMSAGKDICRKVNEAFGFEHELETDDINSMIAKQFSQKVCDLMDKEINARVQKCVADALSKPASYV